ncbi:hypothetical protein HDU93_006626 [Gonapodya sp. JEL0774]|nr:hypothetical protein HDU93_006626 [Gonapodya sp. JEL0774]
MAAWTPEEEEWLVSLAKTYHCNWSLVSELLFSQRLAHVFRSPWDCHDKYVQLEGPQASGATPQNAADTSANGVVDVRRRDKKAKGADGLKKRERLLKAFEAIRRTVSTKKRDPKPTGQQNRRVNLTAHETHLQSQMGAGIDVNVPPLDPLAMSALKAQQDAKVRQQQEAQRMAAAQQQAMNRAAPLIVGGAAGRPFMPMQVAAGRPMPRPSALGTPMLGSLAAAGARPLLSQPGAIRIPNQATQGLLQEQLRQIGQAGQMNQIAAMRQAQTQQQIQAGVPGQQPVGTASLGQATIAQQQAAAVTRGLPLQYAPADLAFVQNAVSGTQLGSVAATPGLPAASGAAIALRPGLGSLMQAQQSPGLNVFQNTQLTIAPDPKRQQMMMMAAIRQNQFMMAQNMAAQNNAAGSPIAAQQMLQQSPRLPPNQLQSGSPVETGTRQVGGAQIQEDESSANGNERGVADDAMEEMEEAEREPTAPPQGTSRRRKVG